MTNRPKIVILDGYAANPGDLSWEEMEKLGEKSASQNQNLRAGKAVCGVKLYVFSLSEFPAG